MDDKSKAKHDPGWNDPPLFTYDKATAIQASASKKGTLLNKRVAYPMTGEALSTNAAAAAAAPPSLPKMESPPMVPSISVKDSSCISEESEFDKLSKTEKLDKVLKNLELLIPAKDDGEIRKRLKIMEKMWLEDELDPNVQSKLFDLTEALCKGNLKLAVHLQIGLMVDYVSQCSSWMSGIRQIISYKRLQEENKKE